MNTERTHWSPRSKRAGMAALVAGAFLTGAGWQGVAAGDAAQRVVPATPSAAVATEHHSYAPIVDMVSPAVVTIRVEAKPRMRLTGAPDSDLFRRFFDDDFGNRFFGDDFSSPRQLPMPQRRGIGSGVVVSADGYILTNHHVVDSAERIVVEFQDGRTMTAELVGSDSPTDLAVLKVDGSDLPTLALGDSDAVRVGDVVLAIGNPLNVGQTVTMGIISAKGRSTGVGDGSYEDFLQTDAPINHGNSGGALVNTKGELIGINTQILSPSGGNIGIGFSIPANMARHVMNELRNEGRVRRAQLGVTIQPVTSEIAASLDLDEVRGAIVSAVAEGSAAEQAGIERGDVIVSYDGEPVTDTNRLRNQVAGTLPGSEAKVGIVRDGRERTVTVKLGEAESPRAPRRDAWGAADDRTALGVAVVPLTPERAAQAGLDRDAKGLLVEDVRPDGRAARAGLRPGDVIQEVNRKPVTSVDDLRAELRTANDRPVLLLVAREGTTLFVPVRAS
jgi:serine protease Do